MTGHIDPTKQAFAEFRGNDRAGPIHMLNLVRLRARANYPDGRQATGAEAYAAYGRESGPVFARLGGKIVWRGTFEQMVIGPSEERWDRCFVAEYPAVAAFVEMIRDPRLSRGGQAPPGGGARISLVDPPRPAGGGAGFGDRRGGTHDRRSIPRFYRKRSARRGKTRWTRPTSRRSSGTSCGDRRSPTDSSSSLVVGSTGAIVSVEFEDGVLQDLKDVLDRLIPRGRDYHHERAWGDGNAHSASARGRTRPRHDGAGHRRQARPRNLAADRGRQSRQSSAGPDGGGDGVRRVTLFAPPCVQSASVDDVIAVAITRPRPKPRLLPAGISVPTLPA